MGIFKNKLIAVLMTFIFLTACIPVAFAESNDYNYTTITYDGGSFGVYEGGLNRFQGKKAKSREEMYEIENRVKNCGYIQIFGVYSDIQENELAYFRNYDNGFWFQDKIKETEYNHQFYKVFVNKLSFNDFVNSFKENKTAPEHTVREIEYSTVVLCSDFFEDIEKAGKIDNEIGDAIPNYFNVGYIKITTSVNMRLLLYNNHNSRYYIVDIDKNKDNLIKIKTGAYHVFTANGKDIADLSNTRSENALPYNNIIQISSSNGKDNPYTLELNQLIKKYELKDVTDEEKAAIANDKVPDAKNEINKEQTKIDNDELKNFVKSSNNIILPILFVLIAVVASLWIIYEYKKRKKIKNEDVEKSGSAVQERYKNQ